LKIINENISELKKCNEKPNILKKSKHHEYQKETSVCPKIHMRVFATF
jgi:hypothetical protein